MNLDAIVVAYNSEETIIECVTSLLEGPVTSVVVMDNSDNPRTSERLQDISDQRLYVVRTGHNLGFGSGVNAGVATVPRTSASDALLIVNPDCTIRAPDVDRLVAAVADHQVGVVAPRMQYPDGTFGIAGGQRPTVLKEAVARTRVDEWLPRAARRITLRAWDSMSGNEGMSSSMVDGENVELDWVSGFCMLIRRDVFDELGGFNEAFFLYFEDVDLCLRLSAAGYRCLLVRGATAMHKESHSTGAAGKGSFYRDGLHTYFETYPPRNTLDRLILRALF